MFIAYILAIAQLTLAAPIYHLNKRQAGQVTGTNGDPIALSQVAGAAASQASQLVAQALAQIAANPTPGKTANAGGNGNTNGNGNTGKKGKNAGKNLVKRQVVVINGKKVAAKTAANTGANNGAAAAAAPAATPVGQGNDPACSAGLNTANTILQTMNTLLTNINARPASAPGGNLLSQNLNDLATYEQAVPQLNQQLNAIPACNGAAAISQAFSPTRDAWYAVKAQIRAAQLNAGAPNGTPATPAGNNNAAAKKAAKRR